MSDPITETEETLSPKFAYARPSAVPNAGQDFDKSARHKRNAWRSLVQAEQDGSATELVTRDNLLKNEPPKFTRSILPATAMSHLVAFLILKSFPPRPYSEEGYTDYKKCKDRILASNLNSSPTRIPAEIRADYYQAYSALKTFLEVKSQSEPDPFILMNSARTWTSQQIRALMAVERYSPLLKSMSQFESRLTVRRRYRTHDVGGKIAEFTQILSQAYPEPSLEVIERRVLEVMNGHPLSKAFGDTKSSSKPRPFKESDSYGVGWLRLDGRQFLDYDLQLLIEGFGLRGLQWGNSVSDKERLQHLKALPEAFADLADVIGWTDKEIALNGLGIAIGARGRSNALAHYEPTNHLINLSRNGGIGSLAHEWGHAWDVSMAQKYTPGAKNIRHLSIETSLSRAVAQQSCEPSLVKAMFDVIQSMKTSGYNDRLRDELNEMYAKKKLSQERFHYYYSIQERFARCFERYIEIKLQQQGRCNSYLAGRQLDVTLMTDEEALVVSPAIEGLLAACRSTVLNRER